MPATEQSWRDLKKLHGFFMISGISLLFATMWMFYADHNREWKKYHDTARKLDLSTNDWAQIQYRTEAKLDEHSRLTEAWKASKTAPVAAPLFKEFTDELKNERAAARLESLNADLQKLAAEGDVKDAASSQKLIARHDQLLEDMRTIAARKKFEETTILERRKNTSALLDAAKAKVDIGVRDSLPADAMKKLQDEVDAIKANLDRLTLEYQDASAHRKRLEATIKRIRATEDEAKRLVDANTLELNNLKSAFVDRRMTYFTDTFPYLGKKWLTWPVLDAFNSPRNIDNLWSDGLTIDYNFQKVRRFDRCTTCHQSIEKSLPGQADKPLFVKEQFLDFVLETPAARPAPEDATLEKAYGIRLAEEGILAAEDVTISFVMPMSAAARADLGNDGAEAAKIAADELRAQILSTGPSENKVAPYPTRPGMMFGDVIVRINDDLVRSNDEAKRFLLDSVRWGKPLRVQVRRGMSSPSISHPRLDLFVGATSPHKVADFACTICHEGQGSATQFKWASHMPNDPAQRKEWIQKYGWIDNHHWIYPMQTKRFAESVCLKCHHNVVELEPSARFPEPPAPKVTHGYHLIRKYGCYGCHEINGFDGPDRRIGPDLRLEPNFFAAAQEIKAQLQATKSADGSALARLTKDELRWLDELIEHPEQDHTRRRLYESLAGDEKAKKEEQRFPSEVHKLASVLKDVDSPGDLRKPGPSLRYAASKLDDEFLYDWIREPKHFRPDTRMPQFFGLLKHLDDEPESKKLAHEYEPIEILGITSFLKGRSQEFAYLKAPEGVTPSSDAEQVTRGKVAFEERGCLACHNHQEFAGTKSFRQPGEIVQGPDLTGIGTKFDAARNPKGRDWLYSWIKQPSKYHARTVMPDLFLDPIVKKVPVETAPGAEKDDAAKKEDQKFVVTTTDPAADIVAFLLTSTNQWKPESGATTKLNDASRKSLDKFVRENLRETFYEAAADRYAKSGIPASMSKELKGAEKELILASGELSDEQKLLYVGRKSISKYGCYGCHDIPGFEDAKPIGAALADWGRKDPSKLAFEHVTHYLHAGHGGHGHGAGHEEMPPFYKEQLESGNRTGFIYQKLTEPRSYDYLKTANKRYNERLRMPQFPFSVEDREDVITFVLGLVADPPAAKFVYKPDARAEAMIAGRQVLDKFNCAGCHMLEPEKWNVTYQPGQFGEQPEVTKYPFLKAHFSADALAASAKQDRRGKMSASLAVLPAINDADGRPNVADSEGDTIEVGDDTPQDPKTLTYALDLWAPAAIDGKAFEAGVVPLNIAATQVDRRYSSRGGVLTKFLLPRVLEREKQTNPAAKGGEAWAWLPPPLMGEGKKVQSQWLHDFLLNPYPIRPAVVLRMPRFNMSSSEATDLVKYFSALDDAEYPYEYGARRQTDHLAASEAAYRAKKGAAGASRLEDAMKIVTNGNYCVKCHIVADFEPKGADRGKAPNLARIYERLRPNYLREWIANPKQILPYTSMPVNIPYAPADEKNFGGVSQDLYHGTSFEQVDALVDLLMNFDVYAKQKSLVAPLVQTEPAKPAEGGEKKESAAGGE